MKRLLFGCTMILSGMIGAAGMSCAYSGSVSELIIKDIFEASKLDALILLLCIALAVYGVVFSLNALKESNG